MTETTTITEFVREFRNRLPTTVDQQLHSPQRLIVLVQKAALAGWTAQALAQECGRNTEGVMNAGGLVMHRLDWCAEHTPVKTARAASLPLCGDCDHGWRLDPITFLPAERCPCRTPA